MAVDVLEGVAVALLLLLNEGDEVVRKVVVGEEGLEWVDDVFEYECWMGDEVDVANLDEAAPMEVGLFSEVGVDGDDGMIAYDTVYSMKWSRAWCSEYRMKVEKRRARGVRIRVSK